MRNRKMLLQVLLSMALVLSLIIPASVLGASATEYLPDDFPVSYSAVDGSSAASAMALNTPQAKVIPMVAAGVYHNGGA